MTRRKRAKGEGTIRKRSDGLWEARLPIPGRNPKSFYGKTQAEAIAKRDAAKASLGLGVAFDAESIAFGEYLYRWLETSVKGSVRERTYDRAESNVRVHLVPTLGAVKLSSLTPAHLQGLYYQRLSKGLKPRTVLRIHQTANRALEQAVKWRLISSNPAKDASTPKPQDEEINPLTREQVDALLSAASSEWVGDLLCVVAVLSGLRAGEVYGLRWKDVDFEQSILRVRQQLLHPRSGLKVGPPKNESSRRAVDVPPQVIEALKKRRIRQAEERLAAGTLWQRQWDGLVFTRPDGAPLDVGDATRRVLRPLLKRAGIPTEGIRFHDLRHTFATLNLLNGVHPRVVQQALGHSTIAETMNRYSHVLPSMGKDAARRLGELF